MINGFKSILRWLGKRWMGWVRGWDEIEWVDGWMGYVVDAGIACGGDYKSLILCICFS